MDENEKKVVATGLVACGVGFIVGGIGMAMMNKRLNKLCDVVVEHLEMHYQDLVDERFENIVENFDE